MQTGIYKIESRTDPARIYIGSSVVIRKRWRLHLRELKGNRHHSSKLQYHYNKYGEDDLEFSILEECGKDDLLKTEQKYLDLSHPYFNCCPVAGAAGLGRAPWNKGKTGLPNKGIPRTEEAKKKMSEARKGIPAWNKGKKCPQLVGKGTGFQKGAVSCRKGVHLSDETKKKISIAREGKKMSEETKKKISEILSGDKNPFRGKHHSETARAKMVVAWTRREPASEETRRKMSIAHTGKKIDRLIILAGF